MRLVDSEGETQREITKDTRLGMCAAAVASKGLGIREQTIKGIRLGMCACTHCVLFLARSCTALRVPRLVGVCCGSLPLSRNCS